MANKNKPGFLKKIQRNLGATILYVKHDQAEATTMADRIGVLEEGKLVQVGTPEEIYNNPKSTYVAHRLGSPRINIIDEDSNVIDIQLLSIAEC